MIPMCMRLDIRSCDRPAGVRLFLPVILVWIIAFALLVAALPFVLVTALVTMYGGPGVRLLRLYPVLAVMLFSLSGLRVDIASHRGGRVFISFD
jgi:hypothetical protein